MAACVERVPDDERGFDDVAGDQMFLDDPFEHRRIALAVPRAFRVHDRNRAAFTDAEAVGFRTQDASLLRQAELFEATLKKIPGDQAALLLAAFRLGLIAAQENVPPGGGHANRIRNALLVSNAQLASL
jgi:hypothetical protein